MVKTHVGFIALHLGAGDHSKKKSDVYKKICQKACLKAVKMINQGNEAAEVLTEAISILENAEETNAGKGSNLNEDGNVEMDASIMEASLGHYGAVGAISGVPNPIQVAYDLMKSQEKGILPLGRMPPSTLVAAGALKWAEDRGLPTCDTTSLITSRSLKTYHRSKQKYEMALKAQKRTESQRLFNLHIGDRCTKEGVNERITDKVKFNLKYNRDKRKADDNSLTKDFMRKRLKVARSKDELGAGGDYESMCFYDDTGANCEVENQLGVEDYATDVEIKQERIPNGEAVINDRTEGIKLLTETINNKKDPKITINQDTNTSETSIEDDKITAENNNVELNDERFEMLYDTVGAVVVDAFGKLVAGVSSGGIILKHPGRLGQAAMYGCGCWARKLTRGQGKNISVGVSTTGCGEQLTRVFMAKTLAECVVKDKDRSPKLFDNFYQKFMASVILDGETDAMGGSLLLESGADHAHLRWAFTTPSMIVAAMPADASQPDVFIDRLDSCVGDSYSTNSRVYELKLKNGENKDQENGTIDEEKEDEDEDEEIKHKLT